MEHLVRLVHHRDVVKDALAIHVHALDAVLDDHGNLVCERRIVGHQVGHRQRQHVAVAVLMLQSFARQRSASRRATQQESAAAHVARCPHQIADALQPEHRIENKKRDGVDAVCRIRRAGGDERAH